MNTRMFYVLIVVLVALSISCKPSQDHNFQTFYENFNLTMEAEPMIQALIKNRLFIDSSLVIPKKSEVDRILAYSKTQLHSLHTFETERLKPELHEHHKNAHDFLALIIDKTAEEKIYQTQPSYYSALPYLEFLTEQNSIEKLGEGLEKCSLLFDVAIQNLKPKDSTELEKSIREGIKTYEMLTNEMEGKIENFKSEKEKYRVAKIKLIKAKLAVKNYIAFCRSSLFELNDLKYRTSDF